MSVRLHTENPAELLEDAYWRVQRERMADVPILNSALRVEAVDFQRWQGNWLGVVVTPWCMVLTLVPGTLEAWASPGVNQRRFVKFPFGNLAFLGNEEPEVGEFQTCSLFSPMHQFASQADAVLTARASVLGLFNPQATQAAAALTGLGSGVAVAAAVPPPTEGRPRGTPASEPASAEAKVLSRRRFLGLGSN